METRMIIKLIFGALIVITSSKCWGTVLLPNEGFYGARASYFKVFVSERLLGSHPKRYCQFVEFPAFQSPSAIFIYYSSDINSYTLVHRSFVRLIWNDLVEGAQAKKIDPFVNYNQAIILEELSPEITERIVPLTEEASSRLLGLCDEILSDAKFGSALSRSFDGDHLYFYHNKGSRYVSGAVDQSNKGSVYSLYNRLKGLIED